MSTENMDDKEKDLKLSENADAPASEPEAHVAPVDGGRKKTKREFAKLGNATSVIAGTATVIMIAFVLVNIITRRVFNYPIRGFYDITGLLGIVFYTFAIVYAGLKGKHISVKVVLEKLPKKAARKVKRVNQIILAISSALLCYASVRRVVATFGKSDVTTDLRIPLNPFRIIIALGFFIMTVLLLLGVDFSGKEDD